MKQKTIWHYLGVTIKWLSGLFLGLILLICAINAFDEDLTPETQALLEVPANRQADENNLYLALMGFGAPPGQSIISFGQARVSAYEKDLEDVTKRGSSRAADVFLDKNSPELACVGKVDFIQPLTSSVWRDVDGHRAEIVSRLSDNKELFARYHSLHAMTGYYDKSTPSIYQQFGYVPKEIRSLFLANVALRMKGRDARLQTKAMADLEKDIQIWRTMLAGNGSLISPMIAVANLQADFLLLADIIADRSLDLSAFAVAIERMANPFDPSDWKIGKALAYEYRVTATVWDQLERDAGALWRSGQEDGAGQSEWWQRGLTRFQFHFFKKNSTLNLNAEAMLNFKKMADAEPAAMLAAQQAVIDWQEKNAVFGLGIVYNPIGKILVGIAAPSYGDYALRAIDAAALQRLVRLGYEIRRQAISEKNIPQFIEKHPEWAMHPVNGEFFQWNAEKGEIALKPVAKQQKDRRFSIPVWR
jgi:hypothetical protein